MTFVVISSLASVWQALPRQWPICRTMSLLLMTPAIEPPGSHTKTKPMCVFDSCCAAFSRGVCSVTVASREHVTALI